MPQLSESLDSLEVLGTVVVPLMKLRLGSTFGCPGSQGAAVINDVVEGQRDDQEGAVAGRVHLEGHVALVQPNCLALLGQRRLEQLSRHLENQ